MPKSLNIETYTVNELTPEFTDFIQNSQMREFGDDSMVYALPEWYLLGHSAGNPVAQVGVLQRTITVDQKSLLIGGVGFLITEPEHRGRGFATSMMKEAMSFVGTRLGLPYALLTCKPKLESLYSGMGWRTASGLNVFVQPTGSRSCGGLIMVRECGGLSWPDGKIDLCGLPW